VGTEKTDVILVSCASNIMKLKLYPNTGLLEILDNKEIFNKAGFTGTINVMAC
jgi:hypothetical protein